MRDKNRLENVYRQILTLLANALADDDPTPTGDKVIAFSFVERKISSKDLTEKASAYNHFQGDNSSSPPYLLSKSLNKSPDEQ